MRIRYLKPGFHSNETLALLEPIPWPKLTFAGLWNLADSAGRLEDSPKWIDGQLFPYNEVDIERCLAALAGAGFIIRYEVNGDRFIAVTSWQTHGKPHPKETPSTIPAVPAVKPRKSLGKTQSREKVVSQPSNYTAGPRGDGDGDGDGEVLGDRDGEQGASALVALWNERRGTLPKCQAIGPGRRKHATARLGERPLADWGPIIDRIAASDFCNGRLPDRGTWVADFDWLVKPETAIRVLEGKYDNRQPVPKAQPFHIAGPKPRADDDWFEECKRLHGGACNGRYAHSLKVSA